MLKCLLLISNSASHRNVFSDSLSRWLACSFIRLFMMFLIDLICLSWPTPSQMQAVTKKRFPSDNCNLRLVKVERWSHCKNSAWSSNKRSLGTSERICYVSMRSPRQIVHVKGGQSFSGDDCRPSLPNNSLIWQGRWTHTEEAPSIKMQKTVPPKAKIFVVFWIDWEFLVCSFCLSSICNEQFLC